MSSLDQGHSKEGQPLTLPTSSAAPQKSSRLPVISANKIVGFPDMLKARPLSAVDTCNHDARESRSAFTSATLSLRRLLGHMTGEEQSSRSVTQTHTSEVAQNDPQEEQSMSPATTIRSRHSHHRSPSRSLRRSPSNESLATASSSEAPATPRAHSPLLSSISAPLADLEHTSRFRVHAVCAACKKTGSNFPSCAKCGETWCSRDCRVKGSNALRHICRGSRV